LLICGASGTGKSSLALALIALGAELVSDDRVVISKMGSDHIVAAAPPAISGLIEARGLGIIQTGYAGPTQIAAVLDLSHSESMRLPQRRLRLLAGVEIPLLYRTDHPQFASALFVYLSSGRKLVE
jgi:HPr kinase/phosphorylase